MVKCWLQSPSAEDLERVRKWRNEKLEALRTPFPLTKEMQSDFADKILHDRNANYRFWSVYYEDDNFRKNWVNRHRVGLVGLTTIQWENRLAEISLIVDPANRGKGIGEKAVELLLDQAFNYLNLRTVYGECYLCNSACDFWKKIGEKYNAVFANLPARKYWQGKYFNSLYFSIDRDEFRATIQ